MPEAGTARIFTNEEGIWPRNGGRKPVATENTETTEKLFTENTEKT